MSEDQALTETQHATSPLDLAIATYSAILQAFRARLQAQGTDLDAVDPQTIPAEEPAREALIAERLTMLALSAPAFAAQPSSTVVGTRPIAPLNANLRWPCSVELLYLCAPPRAAPPPDAGLLLISSI